MYSSLNWKSFCFLFYISTPHFCWDLCVNYVRFEKKNLWGSEVSICDLKMDEITRIYLTIVKNKSYIQIRSECFYAPMNSYEFNYFLPNTKALRLLRGKVFW